ncbi:MAG: LysM peptidoglycan-binding domain-containing protein [Actinomycetota bacterium]
MRTSRLVLSILALLALAAILVGLPLVLVLAVGWPIPDPWPSSAEFGDILAGRAPVPAELVVSALAVVMWLLWVQVAWAVVVEVLATFRGRLARRAPVLPGLQLTIGKLVTTATLLTTSFSARPVAAGPLPAVAVTQVEDAPVATGPADADVTDGSTRSSGPALRAYQTEPGDTWWGIAEDTYGSGTRWKEIRNLNLGRTMDDGSVISVATDLLRPDWRLLLPAGAVSADGSSAPVADAGVGNGADVAPTATTAAASASEPAVAETAAATATGERPEVVVERGDTLWDLAEDDLQELGREASTVAVAERVDEIAEINRQQLDGDPDLIYPGQRLTLPERPPLAERSPGVGGPPDAIGPGSGATTDGEAPATDGSGADGAAADAGAADETATDGVAGDGGADDGSTDDSRTDDGRTGDSRTDDSRTDDGRTGDSRTDDSTVDAGATDGAGAGDPASDGSADAGGDDASADGERSGPVEEAAAGGSGSDGSEPGGDPAEAPSAESVQAALGPAPELPAPEAAMPIITNGAGAAVGGLDLNPSPADPADTADSADTADTADNGATGRAPDATTDDNARAEPASAGRSLDTAPADGAEGGSAITGADAGAPGGDGDDADTVESRGALSPLSPAAPPPGAASEDPDAPLAGARALAPDWVPPTTPEATFADDLPTAPAPDATVPTSSGRALLGPAQSRAHESVELPTAGRADNIEVAINASPGADEEGLDTATARAPVFAGLAALTLIGGYLFRARGRRRKTVLQHRHAGRRPAPTKRRSRPLTRKLAAAAEVEHPDFVNLGLRALGRLLHDVPPEDLPKVSGIWVSQNRLVLALDDDSPRLAPPAPFTPFADGSGWSLLRTQFDEIRSIARGANGPLPLLTTVGTTTSLDLALTTNSRAPAEAYGLASSLLFAVDLEAGRVISVDGPRRAEVVEALMMMAIELATSETADQAEIVCVGFGHRLANFDRVMVVDDLTEIMSDLEDITSRAIYASAEASPFATRVGDGAADTWNPVIVFHADPDDPEAQSLVEMAELTEGGVTAVCGYPTDRGWRFLLDGEQIHCPELPGSLASHRFNRPRPGDVDDVIDLFDEGWDEIDLDEAFWAPIDPTTDLSLEPVGAEATVDEARRSAPVTTESGRRRGAPAGPSTETDLPRLNLRHSTEHHPTPPPAPTRPGAPADPTQDELMPSADADGPDGTMTLDAVPIDEVNVRPAGGRHLYVVETTREPAPDGGAPAVPGADPDPTDPLPAGDPVAGPDTAEATAPSPDRGEADRSGSPAEPVLGVDVLGQFTIGGHHVGDRAKPWKYTKTAELILYLLLHPEGASQDLLMEQLFPEQPANRPRLNQLVSDARTKALGVGPNGEYLLPHASPTEPFYRLTATVGFDLRDFAHHCARARRAESPEVEAREWEAALRLVQGRPFTLPHDGYGWAMPEIEATIVKVEEAAVALADLAIEQGDHRLAVWATKKGLLTGTGYYELLVKRGRAAHLLEDPEEIVRAFADLQVSLDHTGAPEEGVPDPGAHPDLIDVYNELSDGGRGRDRTT